MKKLKPVAPFMAFVNQVLHWKVIKNENADEITRKFLEKLKANYEDYGKTDTGEKIFFKFFKYARFTKHDTYKYGFALISWWGYGNYRIMPHLSSYCEKDSSEELNQIIEKINADFDAICELEANQNVFKIYSPFIIPQSYFRQS